MRRQRGFTLVEVIIAVFILLLLLTLAVPSLNGVLADKRLHRSLDRFNELVRQSFVFKAEDGIRYLTVTGVQTCALPISGSYRRTRGRNHVDHRHNGWRRLASRRPPWRHRAWRQRDRPCRAAHAPRRGSLQAATG